MDSQNGSGGNGHDPDEAEAQGAVILDFRRPQDNRPPQREKLFNLPTVTKYFILLLAVIHIGLQIAGPLQKEWVYEHFGFVPGAYTGHVPFTAYALISPFTYMLLHGSWLHLIMNSLMLAAFGAGIERMMGGRKMLILFMLCGLAAIAVQFVINPSSTDTVIGASGGLSGFFAVILVTLQQMNGREERYGLLPFVIFWILVQAGFGSTGIGTGGANVAWIAHIGGFLAGFVLLKPVLRLK
jgi:membrane associated rhomboid family serine protease